ncbi:MAG: hypothetical protein WDN75_00245 [Bacteroidota bacterium]
MILQVQSNYGVSESSASILEAFKDLSIAIVSFLVASYITRIGYKNSMLFALGFIASVCFANALSRQLCHDKAFIRCYGYMLCPDQSVSLCHHRNCH